MPTLRNRRLETLFGGPIDESLTFRQVMGLIPNAGEGPDLDFKQKTYVTSGEGGHKGTKSLCSDIASMANAAGGVIVLGIQEDDQARAKSLLAVDTSDSERRRLRQTVYGNVLPAPTFDVIPVEDPDDPGHGFLVIWVARSAGAPHALCQGNSLHYPRRVGTETIWLSEAEIAEAYRARFAGLADRLDRAGKIEADFLTRLNPEQVFVVVTLVPDLPGMFTIDSESLQAFATAYSQRRTLGMGIPMSTFSSTLVRYRRLVASGNIQAHQPYSYVACELHQDGSGTFAAMIDAPMIAPVVERPEKLVDNSQIVAGTAAALRLLGSHARDRAAAGGLANLRTTIWPSGPNTPIALVTDSGVPYEYAGAPILRERPTADAVADLDDLAANGPGQVATTYRLASGLHQAFGKPETALVTADGRLRIRHWHPTYRQALTAWANASGVEVTNDMLS